MTAASTTTQTTEMTQKPEMSGMLSTLHAIPGLRRAWPEHRDSSSTSVSIECVDSKGRLRAGHVTAGSAPDLLPYATDPALPALSARLTGALVVHRAGRRAVVMEETRVRKIVRPHRAAALVQAHATAASVLRITGLRTPRILNSSDDIDDIVDLELLPGRSLDALGDTGLPAWRRLADSWAHLARSEADLPVHGPRQEAEVLRRIGRVVDDGRLSFDVPRVSGSLRQQGAHIQVRSHVEGKPIPVETLRPGPGMSAGLGKALGEIHELAVTVISEAGMPVYDAEEVRRRWLSLLDDTATTGKTPPTLLGRWEQALEDTALWRFRPTVVHGDLAEENMLVAGGSVVAVRGWTQAHVGDPAEDLAWVYSSAPVDCLDSIEDAYDIARSEGVDRHLRERAELVSELSLARWLLHGVRTGNKPVINDAVAMLEDLAAQVGDAPLVEPASPRLAPVPGEREPAEPDAVTDPVAMVRIDDEDD